MHLRCDILYLLNNIQQRSNHNKGGDNLTDSEKLDLILSEMQNIKGDTQELKEKVSVIENKVTDIKLTLENELRRIKAQLEIA